MGNAARYYKFAQRGFNNEFVIVRVSNNEKYHELADKFISDYGINARIWSVTRKELTKNELLRALDNHYKVTDEDLSNWHEVGVI